MQIHEVKRSNPNKASRQVGRGGKRGKTAGRGMKGQKARAGNKRRPEMRDIIKRVPKKRGFGKNRARTVHAERIPVVPVNLKALETAFENGETVSPVTLIEKKVVSKRGGKLPKVKILGTGSLTKKVTVSNCVVSKAAAEHITKAGGTVEA
jgi:large subunit ribosomal protein L15